MTATFLQDDLVDELKELLKDFKLKDPEGNESSINVFKQFLPIPERKKPEEYSQEELEEGLVDTEIEEDPYPYIIVRLEQGTIDAPSAEQEIIVNLIIGVIDRSLENQGHKDVLNIIHDIYNRFAINPVLAHKYECTTPINWALQEEESFPYFIGGMALRFLTIPIRREDKNT